MKLAQKTELILDKIRSSNNIIITSHINPDGDAIGSLIGMGTFIEKKFNKKPKLLINSSIPNNLKFLKGTNKIIRYDDTYKNEIINADLFMVLDLNDLSRIGDMAEGVEMSNAYKIVIDHHKEPKDFADLYYVDDMAASTGGMIWDIIKYNDGKINSTMANALYTAIMTDTGSFRYERTDEGTHLAAASLIEAGADPVKCYDCIYNNKSWESLRLLGRSISNIESYHDGRLSIMSITKEDYEKAGAAEGDTEGFSDNTLSMEGVEVGILMKEKIDQPVVKISFRSKGNYPIRSLAGKFGGGGHNFACGARVDNQDFEVVKQRIVEEASSVFNKTNLL